MLSIVRIFDRIGVFDVSIWISPSLLSAIAGFYIRERGIPERINRTALGAMMARGPLGNAIVFMLMLLLFPRRPPLI